MKPFIPYCHKCDHGWIRVADPVAKRIYKDPKATALLRCDCRKGARYWQHEKKLEPWRPPQ